MRYETIELIEPKIIIKNCKNCDEEFIVKTRISQTFFCSKKCRHRYFSAIQNAKAKIHPIDDYMPIKTFLEITGKKMNEVLKEILKSQKNYQKIKDEWYINEKMFDIFPALKTVAEL